MKYLIPLFLILSACSQETMDTFSPTYGGSGCVAASSLNIEEILYYQKATVSSTASACCEDSGLLACCFGGVYKCVDGKEGTGCGCPER